MFYTFRFTRHRTVVEGRAHILNNFRITAGRVIIFEGSVLIGVQSFTCVLFKAQCDFWVQSSPCAELHGLGMFFLEDRCCKGNGGFGGRSPPTRRKADRREAAASI